MYSAAQKHLVIGEGRIEMDTSLLSVVATTELPAVAGKRTLECFLGLQYGYRDLSFDRLLPVNQPETNACILTTFTLLKRVNFLEWAIGLLDVSVKTPIEKVEKLLEEKGYLMTLPQKETVVEVTKRGKNTEMNSVGVGNFFFTKGKLGVCTGVLYKFEDEGIWTSIIYKFGVNYKPSIGNSLGLGARLFIPNFKP